MIKQLLMRVSRVDKVVEHVVSEYEETDNILVTSFEIKKNWRHISKRNNCIENILKQEGN